ncbi:hypothetical protein [Streptomyces marincola]|uniref:hypothetical protein n=1 Tax=Streptomyces marincola TaxID=2878388 RepID=UPI001CF5946A|nr:hypothetical protein [Streptomyces marincola]UCM87795.1 hypothetical protein LC193_07440 [Streptomyces marincola]
MRVGITGHRGLSDGVAVLVRSALGAELARYDAGTLVGVSCVADGPDAWFARAVLERGGRIEVVVPADAYRAGLPEWHLGEYDALLSAAVRVHPTGLAVSDAEAHMAGSQVLVGLVDRLLAVWDGQPARGYGGTADVVEHARRTGVPVDVLWPEGASRD